MIVRTLFLIVFICIARASDLNGNCPGGLNLYSTSHSIEHAVDIYLEKGLYVMEMNDSFGDGWGHGSLHLWDPSENQTTNHLSTGDGDLKWFYFTCSEDSILSRTCLTKTNGGCAPPRNDINTFNCLTMGEMDPYFNITHSATYKLSCHRQPVGKDGPHWWPEEMTWKIKQISIPPPYLPEPELDVDETLIPTTAPTFEHWGNPLLCPSHCAYHSCSIIYRYGMQGCSGCPSEPPQNDDWPSVNQFITNGYYGTCTHFIDDRILKESHCKRYGDRWNPITHLDINSCTHAATFGTGRAGGNAYGTKWFGKSSTNTFCMEAAHGNAFWPVQLTIWHHCSVCGMYCTSTEYNKGCHAIMPSDVYDFSCPPTPSPTISPTESPTLWYNHETCFDDTGKNLCLEHICYDSLQSCQLVPIYGRKCTAGDTEETKMNLLFEQQKC